MKDYTIKSQKLTEVADGKYMYDMEIIVDTEEQIPDPAPDNFAVGSLCIIANTHQYKWLNSERRWV